MRIRLIHPPLADFPSGGNRYDEGLLEDARRQGHPFHSITLPPNARPEDAQAALATAPAGLTVWDSLFLPLLDRLNPLPQPSILLVHWLPSCDLTPNGTLQALQTALERRVAARLAGCIATGERVFRTLQARHPGRTLRLCEPGVAPCFLAPPPPAAEGEDRAPLVLTVANLLPAKDPLFLLDALRHLAHLPWRWTLIGDTSRDAAYCGTLLQRIQAWKLEERVRLTGALPQEEIVTWLDRAALFAFASRFESYGMALAEAAARRLPIVTTDVGAARELIDHGHSGYIVPVGDRDRYVRCLRRLLEDSELRLRFRREAPARTPRRQTAAFNDFQTACQEIAPSCTLLAPTP